MAATPLISQAVDESQLTVLKGNVHPLAREEFDLGTAPASLPMERMLLVLKRSPEQELALRKLLDDQQDETSPNYHKWLTPEGYGRQFGPTDYDMQTVTAWLHSHGFQVGTTKGRSVLEFSGSAGQVEEAFHTTIHKYLVNGEQHWANDRDPAIPAALTPAVAGVDSLNDFRRKAMNRFVGMYSAQTRILTTSEPNYTFTCGNGYTCYGVVPYDFATIYNVLPLWNATPAIDGAGQTIAIVGRTDINPADATNFWQIFGLTVPANKLNIIYNGYPPEINGDEPEADIDVQWSGAVAPQATIDFVTSQSTETTDGVDLSAVYIVENNLAAVMSESYGECELGLGTAGNQFYYALWQQAAAQGISVFVSSGDNGSAGCDYPGGPAQYGLNVNGIASTPFNAAIGGTDFNQYKKWSSYWNPSSSAPTYESAKGYIPETTWNNSCTNALAITLGYGSTAEQACNNQNMINAGGVNSTGGSGGPSNCVVNTQGVVGSCTASYPKPSWQKGSGVPADSKRDLPDVSLFASNGFLGSFYVICEQDRTGVCNANSFLAYGGTSVASPAFAGIMALVNQKMGAPQGVPGFALYQLAGKQANAFHEVPSGSTIAMPCKSGSPNCTTNTSTDKYGVLSGYSTTAGYDLATGLGSVDAANLVNNWGKAAFTATTTTLQLNGGSAVNVTHGAAVPVSIDVSPSAAKGTASLLVTDATGTTIAQPIDGFSLTNGATSSTAATSRLPGGSNYYVMAHYSGDGTYGGSYSAPMIVAVTPENSQTQVFLVTFDWNGKLVNSNTNIAVYGSPYLLRVNVENAAGNMCSPLTGNGATACPTGAVSLTDNGAALDAGSYTLNSYGYLEDDGVQLPGGTNAVTAAYAGDGSFNASNASATMTITPAPSSVITPGAPPFASVGDQLSASTQVEALSTGVAPTGAVTFFSNGTPMVGSVTYVGFTVASAQEVFLNANFTSTTSPFTAPGTYTITAQYNGDTNYAPSAISSSSEVAVKYPAPSIVPTPAQQNVSYGGTATITALIDSTNKTTYPTGTVTFGNVAGPITCSKATDARGNFACKAVASFTVTVGGGIYIQYSGDANYPASWNWAYINMPDFVMYGSGVQLNAGQSQDAVVYFRSDNSLSGTVTNFGCSNLPAETTCTFNPQQVTLLSNETVSTTLTVSTQALGQSRSIIGANGRRAKDRAISVAMLLFGVCFIGIPLSRQRGRAASALLLVFSLIVLPTCGGGGGGGTVGPQNPVPSISSLNPAKVAAGSQIQSLYINGTNFISSSTVTYNGTPHNRALMSPTQLQIALSPDDVSNTGQYPVVVTNPGPGGGASAPVNFAVVTGTPTGVFYGTVTATVGPITHTMSLPINVQ